MNQTYYSLGDMPVRDGPSMSSYHVCRAVPGQGYVLTCSNISSWEWRKPPGEIRIKNQEVSASWKLLLPCVVIDLRIACVCVSYDSPYMFCFHCGTLGCGSSYFHNFEDDHMMQ